tara:strand:- start:52 stop:1566 length:1515 start_codon:yes stop_codon:yes gene_type:complete
MRARALIIESLLKEATDEEKLVASILDDVFDDLEADIQSNKDKLAPEVQNEAVGFAIAGSIVSMPALLKLVGKAVAKVQSKLKGEKVDTNTIIKVADKLHHILIGGLEKVLQVVFRIKDKKQAHRLAVILFHAIVAGLLLASGKAFFKALAKHNNVMSILEGLLSAIKSGELGVFLVESFGEIATALGTSAELADAADLMDAIEGADELTEISTMAGGSVEGYSLPLGAKPEDYKMENKLRITKGRLRQILAEEVARHKRLSEAAHDYEGIIEGDFVNIIGGALTGAVGRVVELTVSTQGKPALVVRLTKDADMQVYGKSGDEVIVQPKFVEKDQGMYSMTTLEEMGAKEEEAEADELAAEALEEGMHTGDPKAPPMSAAVFIDMIATKLGMSKEEVAKKMAMAMADIQAAEDSAERAGMSPSAGERERFDRATDDRYSDEFETFADMKYAMAQRDKMEEEAKPDFLDLDGDGDKEESMKKAAADKEKLKKEVRAMLGEMLKDD